MGLFNKKELERIIILENKIDTLTKENEELKNKIQSKSELECDIRHLERSKEISEISLKSIKNTVEKKQAELNEVKDEIFKKRNELTVIERDIKKAEKEINEVEKGNVMYQVGAYNFSYHYEDSESYEKELKNIKEEQREMIKDEIAIDHYTTWTIDNSTTKGERFTRNIDKLLLRAFNNECDNIIIKVKYSTIATAKQRIEKSFKQLNSFVKIQQCAISERYLDLKIKELELRCGYVTLKQQEKEEQARIREQMKEEERVRKEIEEEEKKVEKEMKHFNNEMNKVMKQMAKASEQEKSILEDKIKYLEEQLAQLSLAKEDVLNRKINNKAGYVYIISNKGSFGENIYKIGVTRRLDPYERISELGSASVPFKFDTHATIFSNDAFELENKLHQIFDNNRVNKVNKHKEFFNVSLDEIEKAVKENFDSTVEFNKTILNEEYVLSLSLK